MTWRKLFPIMLLFSCVDGFISNLLYPAKLPLLYKDFFIIGVYLMFLAQEPVAHWMARLRERMGPMAWTCGTCFLAIGVLQIFNPSLPNLLVGLVGFKVMFLYWPLAVLAYAYVEGWAGARRLLKTIVYLSVPINLFGCYQFWAGPEFLINTFGPGFEHATIMAHLEGVAQPEDSFMRVIGTFASSGQYAGFLIVNAMLIFSMVLTSPTKRARLTFMAISLLNFFALLATGSRGGLAAVALMVLVMSWFCASVRRGWLIVVMVACTTYFGFHVLGGAVIERFESLRDMDIVSTRTWSTTPVMFGELLQEAPLGLGLGSGSPASRHLLGKDSAGWRNVENYPSKLQLETGILGVICFYLFILVLSVRWLRRWGRSLGKTLSSLAGPLSANCLVTMGISSIVGGFDSTTTAIFFWVLVGLVAKVSTWTRRAA